MLLEIAISNIALIDKMRLELGEGLNVLTGETGAGKSIVVDALTLVLGGRADRSLIRTGTDRARVEALFDISQNREAQAIVEEWGLESDEGLIPVSRELLSSGRSVCRVCQSVIPLNQFRRLTDVLVELHGQHEHQLLLDDQRHNAYLDQYAGSGHQDLLKAVGSDYARYLALVHREKGLASDLAKREQLMDMLRFQIGEIDAVRPRIGEMEILESKGRLMQSAGKISHKLNQAVDCLYRGTGRSASAQESLKKAAQALKDIAGLDERFGSMQERLDELFYAAQDAGYELQDMLESFDFDEGEADRVASRLSEIKGLTKKYGPEVSDVIALRDEAKARLEELEEGDGLLESVRREMNEVKTKLLESCAALTRSREEAGQRLSKRVMEELSELGMEKARFEVRFEREAQGFSASGAEHAQFMLSANPGEPVRPLSDVASGGELSRIMLAMKAAEAERTGVDSMVFDEIDTGVSGRMAQVVGEKMASIARTRQVICVSHLPQIAALADRQYLVEKGVEEGRTRTNVYLLDREGRIEALARMVGGAGDMHTSRLHAQSMLDAAQALYNP